MTKKRWMAAGLLAVVAAGGGYWWKARSRPPIPPAFQEIAVERGSIRLEIQTTGVVQPQNRLEILPSVAGRVEELLVDEGARVRRGQILAWMSSNERAALLDAALAQGQGEMDKWKDVYKPVPLVAPLDGSIIARNAEPGQRVAATAAVFVMSDHLIVKAQVDETDIGRVREGQQAGVVLDAFPGQKVPARVDKIAHEAKTVNNVTIYEVDIRPDQVPEFFRSGMTGTVMIVVTERTDVLVVPMSAVAEKDGSKGVWMNSKSDRTPRKGRPRRKEIRAQTLGTSDTPPLPTWTPVTVGLTDNRKIEIVEGLREGQVVLVPEVGSPWMQNADGPGNPFSMFGGRRRQPTRSTGPAGGARR